MACLSPAIPQSNYPHLGRRNIWQTSHARQLRKREKLLPQWLQMFRRSLPRRPNHHVRHPPNQSLYLPQNDPRPKPLVEHIPSYSRTGLQRIHMRVDGQSMRRTFPATLSAEPYTDGVSLL